MRTVLGRIAAAALALAFAGVVATAAASEFAKAQSISGAATVTHGGQTSNVGPSTQFEQGDIVRVSSGGRLTVVFADRSSITMVDSATLVFGEMTDKGRRVELVSGAITDATVGHVALEIQAPNAIDASLVLQNAVGFARVAPGDRIVFQKKEGSFAKVWRNGQPTDLGETAWALNVRDNVASVGAPPRASAGARVAGARSQFDRFDPEDQPDDWVGITIHEQKIRFHPASQFTKEVTQGGGLMLCFNGPDGDWGVVEPGRASQIFLEKGQCVEFDANGQVIRSDGISHVYSGLYSALISDESVQDAADASASKTKRH